MKKLLAILLLSAGLLCAQNKSVTQKTNDKSINDNLIFKVPQTLTITGEAPGINSQLYLDGYGQINGSRDSSITIGKLDADDFNDFAFNNVPAMLAVKAVENGKHAIMGRTLSQMDGIGVIGWSSSGAAAVKALQDSNFNSPALTVWRSTKNGTSYWSATSPALLIAKDEVNSVPLESPALLIKNGPINIFHLDWNGTIRSQLKFNEITEFVGESYFYNPIILVNGFKDSFGTVIQHTSSRGFYYSNTERSHPKYLGSKTTAPNIGSIDTSVHGDTYFNNTDGRMYILTPNGWKAITNP